MKYGFMDTMKLYFDVYDSPYWDELYLDFVRQFEEIPYGSKEIDFIFKLVCKLDALDKLNESK